MRRAISYPCSGPSSSTLNTANSAVPRLIPGAIILMLPIYRHLTYKHRNVNCPEDQPEASLRARLKGDSPRPHNIARKLCGVRQRCCRFSQQLSLLCKERSVGGSSPYGRWMRSDGHAANRHGNALRFRTDDNLRMQNLCERLNAGNQTRPRPRKISTGVQRVHTRITHRGNSIPLFRKRHSMIFIARLLRPVTALRYQKNLRRRLNHVFSGNPERRSSLPSQHIFPARNFDHFRNPMPRHVKRLEPFENRNGRPMRNIFNLAFEFAEPHTDFLEQVFGFMPSASRLPNPQNIAPNIAKVLRI